MTSFTFFLLKEQPRINDELSALSAVLPDYVRPTAKYALEGGGKRLRPLLTVLCGRALGYKGKQLHKVGCAVELLHAATLLHDDVLDNADMRRGKPCAHHVFGLAPTLLAADAMFAQGCTLIAEFNNPRMVKCLSNAIVQTANGEIMEIAHQGKVQADMAVYTEIISSKTAWLLRAACELGARMATDNEKYIQAAADFGHNLGMAFQIADDALDFSPSSDTGKPEGGDVREGKFTPPILFYMQSLVHEKRQTFVENFAALRFSEEDVLNIVKAIRDGGFQTQTLQLADNYLNNAAQALAILPQHDKKAQQACELLHAGLDFVRNRTA